MARRRAPIRWLRLLDGPMAGERVSASVVVPGSPVVRLSCASPDEPGMVDRHEYELCGPLEARWVRPLETVPLQVGHG